MLRDKPGWDHGMSVGWNACSIMEKSCVVRRLKLGYNPMADVDCDKVCVACVAELCAEVAEM